MLAVDLLKKIIPLLKDLKIPWDNFYNENLKEAHLKVFIGKKNKMNISTDTTKMILTFKMS